MIPRIVYAKKIRLPSASAHILQSLNMVLAFATAGARVDCFPGHVSWRSSAAALAETMRLVQDKTEISPNWKPLCGKHKGWYGLRFRGALLSAMATDPSAVFYGRDIAELLFLTRLKRFFPRRVFFEAHEVLHLMHKEQGKAGWKKTREREKSILASIDGLIVTTQAVENEIREYCGYHGPLLVAPNGFNPCFFHSLPLFASDAPWPTRDERFILVYTGNFHPGKGIEELITALALLPERFCLRVIGGNPEKEYARLRHIVEEKQLTTRVRFYGQTAQRDIRELCKGAHLFVIPQQSSFFFSPLKLQEAQALGLPVMVAPLPLFSEQRAKGLVFGAPDCQPDGLARGIQELAQQPRLAEQLREKGLREAVEHTWEKRAQNVLEFITSTNARCSETAAIT